MGQSIEGVGPEQPVVVNELGGGQSLLPYRFDLVDPAAMFQLAYVLDHGARKYGDDNWRAISTHEHVNHALAHVYAFLAGDTQDSHLEHAFTRLMMAVAIEEQGGPKQKL